MLNNQWGPLLLSYLRLSLTNCRVYFRYRSRSTAMVKMNQDKEDKRSFESLTCRFCNSNVLESQEHFWTIWEKRSEIEWCDGESDFLEEDDSEDDSDGYSNLKTRGSFTWCSLWWISNFSGCIEVDCVDCWE